MRTESEMYQMIVDIAKQDDRVRAVYMNGSRTNPNVPKDIFQDYDIVYVVTDTKPFYEAEDWIYKFGEPLYMQTPEKMDKLRGRECHIEDTYGWLVIFKDGNRIDLHVNSISYAKSDILNDKLCKILLDKDNILPQILDSTDIDYHVKKPTEIYFRCDCNNFWWCLNNVAKGLWRDEIPYVMDMINFEIRPLLINILSWKIGINTGFSCSVGKSGKFLKRYLSDEMYTRFIDTYSDGNLDHLWSSVFGMCDLFNEVANEIALKLGFTYNHEEAKASMKYLDVVHTLPKDANDIPSFESQE
ncbi:aminoglycoside 6-adenylyltransferase [Anaerosporobacter sp.]